MTELVCRKVQEHESFDSFPEFVRRTKTICLHYDDRRNLSSKDLAKITITADGKKSSEVFCIDARGSKKGHLTAHPSHLKSLNLRDNDKVHVEISEATAEECAIWLRENSDPERKAFGLMLSETISVNQKARENLAQVRLSEANAKAYKDKSYVYATAAFIAGSLLDIGMIEEKFGYTLPPVAIPIAAIVALMLFCCAQRIVQLIQIVFRSKKTGT